MVNDAVLGNQSVVICTIPILSFFNKEDKLKLLEGFHAYEHIIINLENLYNC